MEISIQVIEDNAIVIKGLRSAAENRAIAGTYTARKRKSIYNELKESGCLDKMYAEIIQKINEAADDYGLTQVTFSGWGDTSSSLRGNWSAEKCNVIRDTIDKEFLTVLEKQGYTCGMTCDTFVGNSKDNYYLTFKINW